MEFSIKRIIDNIGRIVLPKDLRDYYNIKSGDTLEFIAEKDGITIKVHQKESLNSK